MYLSIIIPLYNEQDSLIQLHQEITLIAKKLKKNYEIIFINDGSTDDSQKILEQVYSQDQQHVVIIQFQNNTGKAAALHAGFHQSQGQYIIQMDADLQDDPAQIPQFLETLEKGFDMAVGWKQNRQDSVIKNYSSKLFNTVTNCISHVKLHDHNCGFKAYKNEVITELNLYGELHRYIPVLISAQGYEIDEIKIKHRPRRFGTTKYGPIRFIHGFFDLLTVLFITRFRSRPLHFFGMLGLISFGAGLCIATYLTIIKVLHHVSIGNRPLLLFSVMLMIMGVQIFMTGIVGEQVAALMYRSKGEYKIKKILCNSSSSQS